MQKNKFVVWLKDLLVGALMGIASAIPGVSAATIAIICNSYDRLVGSISGVTKHIKESIIVLVPILLGIAIGLVPCLILFDIALSHMLFAVVCLFLGLLIGSFPKVLENVKGEKPEPKQIVYAAISFFVSVSLGLISALMGKSNDLSSFFTNTPLWFYFIIFFVGAATSAFLIIPGKIGRAHV